MAGTHGGVANLEREDRDGGIMRREHFEPIGDWAAITGERSPVRAGEDIRKSIHLGNVGEIWPLSPVAFLRAVSKSCAVFAAATIEFIGVFNV